MPPQPNSAPDFIPAPDAQSDFIADGQPDFIADDSTSSTPPAPQHPVLSAVDRFLSPSDMTGNDPTSIRGIGKNVGQFLTGGLGAIVEAVKHPIDTLEGMGKPFVASGMASGGMYPGQFPTTKIEESSRNAAQIDALRDAGQQWQFMKEHPAYTLGSIAGPMLLSHVITRIMTPPGMAAKLTRGTGGMAADIEPTINDLQAVTKDVNPTTGKPFGPPNTVGDFINHVSLAENKLNSEYANTLGPHAQNPGPITPNGTFPVADAIRALKDKLGDTTAQDKAARSYIDHVASEFDKPLTLDELNRQRIAANGRLYSFEKKSDVAQYAAAGANSGTAVDKAIANTVRDVVYPEMDRLSGKPPGYFRDLQNRVGNLFRLQSDAQDFARSVHQKTMIAKGSSPLERVRPGAAVSEGGGVHGYLSNIPAIFRAPDPEGAANSAVQSAYGLRQQITPPPSGLSLPVASLLGTIRSGKLGPNHPLSQSQPEQ